MTGDRRSWAVGVLVWVLVVLVGSSLVWVVISHAGAGVAPQPGAPVAAGDPVPDAARSGSPEKSATERPTLRPSPRPGSATTPSSGGSAAPPTGSGPESGDDEPGEPGDDSGDDSGAGSTRSPAPPASSGTSATRRTWSGTGGSVVAECTGDRIRLVAAQPDGGFAVEVGNRGPEEIEVAFEGRGDEGREAEVHAVCVGGTPRFAAESHRED